MDSIFNANLLALSGQNLGLCSRLSNRIDVSNRYRFLKSRSGEIVPSHFLPPENIRPLHSTIDPKREAERLVSTITDDTGFLIFLGIGGGFAPEAALECTTARIMAIDFDIDGIAELFSNRDYTKLLKNERFSLFIDPPLEEIKNFILEQYKPALCGGIKTIPLRTRIEADILKFDSAAKAIDEAIENVAGDYSVQVHFGKRWFSNIIRNLKTVEEAPESFTANNIHEAAIVAAGPSLDQQIPALAEYKSRNVFIICSDTALPALLRHGIEPDAAVSIDCQHISYYHFMGCDTRNIPLFLDIASPPLLSRFSPSPFFFSSAHPLALYICQYWRRLPGLDTSGGNVTYACLSLAENLGVKRITLFGADFSYVRSRTYARGTYIYPFFEKKQNRLSPMEALFSSFLYRSPFLPPEARGEKPGQGQTFLETSTLRFYRKKLEEKAAGMDAQITAMEGQGAPVNLPHKMPRNAGAVIPFTTERTNKSSIEFLEQYCRDIAEMPGTIGAGYKLNVKDRQVFTTLLPYAAYLKHRSPALKTGDLIEETKRLCVQEIERVLSAGN